eukprot:TRINITY_DN11247_c0_g1_i1.p1 TRINITY_DN11247_c0_g1~~TRINITY_DN11247_c0_g1_i1.p1  ORF type:complete len:428 (-),score=117.82 TRINITY_DN11247_c0_g1_i1:204-1487(-)
MDYKAFRKLILPYNQRIQPILVKRASASSKLDPIAESRLAKVIRRDIEAALRLDRRKVALRESADFDLYSLFTAIDKECEGFVTAENLGEYLRERGQKDLLEYFIRSLDTDVDGRVSYKEFEEGILPWYPDTDSLNSTKCPSRLSTHSPLNTLEPPKTSSSVRNAVTAGGLKKNYFTPKPFLYYSPRNKQGNVSSTDEMWTEEIKETMGPSRTFRANMKTAASGKKKANLDSGNLKGLKASFGKNIAVDELVAALKEQMRIEKTLEEHKVNLSLQPDLNLLDAFKIFNAKDKDNINFAEFAKGLREIGFAKPEDEIKAMYAHYARNPYKKLSYGNFCCMLLPVNSNCAHVVSRRSSAKSAGSGLSKYTQTMLKKLFNQLVEMEKLAEAIREKLDQSKCFNHYNAFKLMDTRKKGEVTLNDVTTPLKA